MLDTTEILLLYYDKMVDWDKRLSLEGGFITEKLNNARAKKVLDCGCGTGNHVFYLNRQGFDAYGSDLNPLHIKEAQSKSHLNNIKENRFYLEDMTALPLQNNNSYDALLTLGNTLCSLGLSKVRDAFGAFSRVLKPNGLLLGQVLNYESFNRQDKSDVRTALHEDVRSVFVKTFHFEEDHVLMVVNLLIEKDGIWSAEVHTNKMYYLTTEFLTLALKDSGFDHIKFYGSLKGGPFDPQKSKDIVWTAVKR